LQQQQQQLEATAAVDTAATRAADVAINLRAFIT